MKHIVKRGDRYHYFRRVPKALEDYDRRQHIRLSLHTDSLEIAKKKAAIQDQQIEAYWAELVENGKTYESDHFGKVIKRARLMNLTYKPVNEVAQEPIHEIVKRHEAIEHSIKSKESVEAALGGVEQPDIKISDVPEKYFTISQHKIIQKRANEIRKWKNPRKKAIKNFIKINSNMKLTDLQRDHCVKLRDWWIDRIRNENMTINSANKDLYAVKNMVTDVSEHYKLDLDTDWLFKNIGLKKSKNQQSSRPPFETAFISSKVLNPEHTASLNAQARAILYILAETGARPKEICDLQSDHIFLNDPIPYIKIIFSEIGELKTQYSIREIPLIGYALDAIKNHPNGFPDYYDKSDNLSAVLNNYLEDKGFKLTKDHVLYSLRHSFQDRMTEANMPDRVQCELFGHKFDREAYGKGPSLELKKEWLEKIQLPKIFVFN